MAQATISVLAKELRKLRIDFDINRPQMAKELKITDRDLANIEAGRVEADHQFLSNVSLKYSKDRDASDGLLRTLKMAYVNSVSQVTFNLVQMDTTQRLRVLALQGTLAEENSAKNAAAEIEKKKALEAKKAAKKTVVEVVEIPEEPIKRSAPAKKKVEQSVVDDNELGDLDDLAELSDDELDLLTED